MTACPCCRAPVDLPGLGELIEARGIDGHAGAILRAVWNGRGFPVKAQRIFDVMYEDCPDGGPPMVRSYRDMREAVATLAEKLDGTGVRLAEGGHSAGGYRLTLNRS